MTTNIPPSRTTSPTLSQPMTVRDVSYTSESGMPAVTHPGNAEHFSPPVPPIQIQRPARLDARTRAERIKRRCRIEDVVMAHGVLLRVVGDGHHLVGLCPFHREQRASFTVYPETQSFCCFGCHAAGDVITFICLLRQVSFNEALRILGEQQAEGRRLNSPNPAGEAAADAPNGKPPLASVKRTVKRNAMPAVGLAQQADKLLVATEEGQGDSHDETGTRASLAQALLWIVQTLGAQGLAQTPGVLTYLGERGISYALAQRCQLGYLADDLLASLLVGHPTLERTARQIGLLNRAGHTALLRRLIVPEMRQGEAIQLIGRTVPGMRTPMAQIKYHLVCSAGVKHLLGYGAALQRLARCHSGQETSSQRIPRKYRLELQGILVLEGALDYVIAMGWDLPVLSTALLSTYPSRQQLAELLDLQQRADGAPLLLQLDGDSPGQEATRHLVRTLNEQGVRYEVLPPVARVPTSASTYKDLGEIGPLGHAGRALLLTHLERVLVPVPDGKSPAAAAAAAHAVPDTTSPQGAATQSITSPDSPATVPDRQPSAQGEQGGC